MEGRPFLAYNATALSTLNLISGMRASLIWGGDIRYIMEKSGNGLVLAGGVVLHFDEARTMGGGISALDPAAVSQRVDGARQETCGRDAWG